MPLRPRFRHALFHLTTVLPHAAPDKMRFALRSQEFYLLGTEWVARTRIMKLIVMTGVSSGIGRVAAERLTQRGHRVIAGACDLVTTEAALTLDGECTY